MSGRRKDAQSENQAWQDSDFAPPHGHIESDVAGEFLNDGYPIATMRSMGSVARSAISGGTLTS